MTAISTSKDFGGFPGNGDVTADANHDAVITVNGPAVITTIIAAYGIYGDWDYHLSRSFSGRLLVTKTNRPLTNELSNGLPNLTGLANHPPVDFGVVIFDKLIHDYTHPLQYDFSADAEFGALRCDAGECLNVILVAGNHYDNAGAVQAITVQQLSVQARKLTAEAIAKIGNYYAAG